MNGAVLNFESADKNHLVTTFADDLIKNFKGYEWSQNGPLLITRVAQDLCNTKNTNEMVAKEDCKGVKVEIFNCMKNIFYELDLKIDQLTHQNL
ncbi:CLUMA_CG015725, isoform A [Clunio marinus]|uniref:CLUMA_CG015725, isoform A n=1 Tax=Clunio marinus TaxID=568069 RepID=A0A1J1IR18_9DIPT|nr:CLUMA_CG015725, isoform A [Clunio marinus]